MVAIKPVREIRPFIKALVFGPPGSGKTTFAASGHASPGLSPTLFIPTEEGVLSASHTTADMTARVETKQELDSLLHKLVHNLDGLDKYKTVVLDTGTRMQQIVLEDCIQKTIKEKSQARDVDTVYIKDWGDCGKAMRRLVSGFLTLNKNVIITAHSRELRPKSPEGAPERPATDIVPDFIPSLSKTLRGYFNFVWYMTAHMGDWYLMTYPKVPKEGEEPSIIRTKTHGQRFAKMLGPVIKNPGLPDIYNKLQEAMEQDRNEQ